MAAHRDRRGVYRIVQPIGGQDFQAIALAGGWDKTAALTSTRVLRASGGPEREQIPANVKKIMENKAPDLQLRPDDILYVPNSMAKVVSARGIETAIGLGTGILIWR